MATRRQRAVKGSVGEVQGNEKQCGTCGEIFAYVSLRKRHQQRKHDPKAKKQLKRKCPIPKCKKLNFANEQSLTRHKASAHNIRSKISNKQILKFYCAEHDIAHVSISTYEKHLTTHGEERPFACRYCFGGNVSTFKNAENLRQHIVWVHPTDTPYEPSKLELEFEYEPPGRTRGETIRIEEEQEKKRVEEAKRLAEKEYNEWYLSFGDYPPPDAPKPKCHAD